MLLAGQKSGAMYGINPESGELFWKTQVGEGGVLGGIEWGFASAGTAAYASLSSAAEKKAGQAGGVVALNVADGKTKWSAGPAPNTCAGKDGCNTAQPAAGNVMLVFSLDGK